MTHSPSSGDGHLQYLLTAYLFESISEAGKFEVEAHLAECATCRAELAELRATAAALRAALGPSASGSAVPTAACADATDAQTEGGAFAAGTQPASTATYSFEARRLERVLAEGSRRWRPRGRRRPLSTRVWLGVGSACAATLLIAISWLSFRGLGQRDEHLARAPESGHVAPSLPSDNTAYRTSRLETPRFSESATTLEDGKGMVAGGTDERHMTGLDTGAVFDQATFADPPVRSGGKDLESSPRLFADDAKTEAARNQPREPIAALRGEYRPASPETSSGSERRPIRQRPQLLEAEKKAPVLAVRPDSLQAGLPSEDQALVELDGRIVHSDKLLPEGTVSIGGGTRDILGEEAVERADVVDPQNRVSPSDSLEAGEPDRELLGRLADRNDPRASAATRDRFVAPDGQGPTPGPGAGGGHPTAPRAELASDRAAPKPQAPRDNPVWAESRRRGFEEQGAQGGRAGADPSVPEELGESRDKSLAVHDVTDMLNRLESFPGPAIRVKTPSEVDASGGVSPFGGYADDEEATDFQIDAQDLIDLVKESTGGEQRWKATDSKIEAHNGQLLISGDPELRVAVEGLLADARQTDFSSLLAKTQRLGIRGGSIDLFAGEARRGNETPDPQGVANKRRLPREPAGRFEPPAVEVALDTDTQGWSFGVCHDGSSTQSLLESNPATSVTTADVASIHTRPPAAGQLAHEPSGRPSFRFVPEAVERRLRAYEYYAALDPTLTAARFAARPLDVPVPAVGDEGLGRDGFRARYGVNPFVDTTVDHLSTFAMDVDTASYTRARALLRSGQLPPAASVRVEEFVNAFRQEYVADPRHAFSVFADGAPSAFGSDVDLVRVTVKARELRPEERRPAVLTFAVDTSGSMFIEERLAQVQEALAALLSMLNPDDRVGIVAYGSQAYLALPHTAARERNRILGTLRSLEPQGSTNVEAGLDLAYRVADEVLTPKAMNRVVLCSDGVATEGERGASEILERVRVFAQRGIYLSVVGFGRDRYNDAFLEEIANRGNGQYAYVDSSAEAQRVFCDDLPAAIDVLARDAKIQVDWNPAVVSHYRLLGYENRDIRDQDFRNDTIDAGEVGPGSTVTALFEIRRRVGGAGHLGRVFVRFHDAFTGAVEELDFPLPPGALATDSEDASDSFRFIACVAEFAELLRSSYWSRDGAYAAIARELAALDPEFQRRPEWLEVLELVQRAQLLSAQQVLHRQESP